MTDFNGADGERLRIEKFGDDLSSFANLQAAGAITTAFLGGNVPIATIDLASTQIVLPGFNGSGLTAAMFQFVV